MQSAFFSVYLSVIPLIYDLLLKVTYIHFTLVNHVEVVSLVA